MRVLVMGGTGAIGGHVASMGAARGWEVYVTSRGRDGNEGSIRYIRGNALNMEFIESVLSQRWNAIVDFMIYSTGEFQSRLERLLDATDQYLFPSSARVYADSRFPIREDSPRLLDVSKDEGYLSTDEYALAKARQEDLLKESSRNNWTIVRPYITYARERLQLGVLEKEAWLYRALKGRTIVFSQDIADHVTTMTHGRDVAKGILSLIGNREAFGETYHITTDKSYTWNEILEIYLGTLEEKMGKRPNILMVSLEQFNMCHPAYYQTKYDRLYDRRFDTQKIARYVHVANFEDVNTGLKRELEAFLDAPCFKSISWRYEAMKDRLTGERTPLNTIPGVKNKVRYALARYLNANRIHIV